MPRKTLLPGQNISQVDPSGHGFIEESQRGLEGQNYGMASYKKGLQQATSCDILRATASEIKLKHRREYDQLPFGQVLGRGQGDLRGRRTDQALWADSKSMEELQEVEQVDSLSFSDFLPHSVRKSAEKIRKGGSPRKD